jgi:hypothetical protein
MTTRRIIIRMPIVMVRGGQSLHKVEVRNGFIGHAESLTGMKGRCNGHTIHDDGWVIVGVCLHGIGKSQDLVPLLRSFTGCHDGPIRDGIWFGMPRLMVDHSIGLWRIIIHIMMGGGVGGRKDGQQVFGTRRHFLQ